MNVFAHVEARLKAAVEALVAEGQLPAGLDLGAIEASAPRDVTHGDIAANAAMVLAKPAGMKPRDIAGLLKAKLEREPGIAAIEVAGPGFLNFRFEPAFWHDIIRLILDQGSAFGRIDLGNGRPVNVEYVSVNPTGPMHIGHSRGAIFGDALASLLAFTGWAVTREFYVNDAGGQVDQLARSVHLRYREALGEDIGEIPSGLYPGEYLKPVGAALAETHGKKLLRMKEAKWLPLVRLAAVDAMMAEIRADLASVGIEHEVFFSEASMRSDGRDDVGAAIAFLRDRGLVFEGRLERPKGYDGDWEDREQTLFRATAFGDDRDYPLLKADGSYTYFAGDIGYQYNKLARAFRHLIIVLGADHVGYVPGLKAVVAALSAKGAEFDIKLCQIVAFMRDGKPVTMSKRAGTFVTLGEVVDEVGRDAVRFMMLMRRNDAPLDFDLAKVVEQSKDNPVFYVQYAHARAASVFRNASGTFPDLGETSPAVREANLGSLTDPGELDLAKRLAAFPHVVQSAAHAHEPHRVAFYLHDLAAGLHAHWARGNETPHLRFIQPGNKELTASRLALVAAAKRVIGAGLAILGVHAPEEMR